VTRQTTVPKIAEWTEKYRDNWTTAIYKSTQIDPANPMNKDSVHLAQYFSNTLQKPKWAAGYCVNRVPAKGSKSPYILCLAAYAPAS